MINCTKIAMTPKQAMRQVTKGFTDDGITPFKINCGNCVEWADEVLNLLKETTHKVELWETLFGYTDTTHAFLRIDGKFHDAECLAGVDDHMDLPCFAKLFAHVKTRQAVWFIDCNDAGANPHETKRDMTDELVAEYNKENGLDAEFLAQYAAYQRGKNEV